VKYYWYRDKVGNFGDDLNAWLWPRLFGDALDEVPDSVLFVGMGSILGTGIPKASRTIVFGPGVAYGPPPVPDTTWHFVAVRGPHSAAALGLDDTVVQGDPAMLVGRYVQQHPSASRTSLMVHHLSNLPRWRLVARALGWQFIDPTQTVDATLAQLADTRLLLTSAMHGAIVADAMRIPWVAIRSGSGINTEKWADWGGALDLVPRFHDLLDFPGTGESPPGAISRALAWPRAVWRLRRLATAGVAQLSQAEVLARVQDRLLDAAALLVARRAEFS
jgi:succinoglycan biosynthesis protein ExoV